MTQATPKNKFTRYAILVIAVGLLLWSVYQERKPLKSAADLEFRMVTGTKDGTFQVVMMETKDRFYVLDSIYRETFESNDAEIVTRQEHVQLLSNYKDVQYRAGLSLSGKEIKKEVRLSRELFNSMQFEHPLTVEISKKVSDSLLTASAL